MGSTAPVEGGQTRNFGGTGGNPPVSGNINNSNAMGNSEWEMVNMLSKQ